MNGRISMMGCFIDNLTMSETVERIAGFIQSGHSHQHVVVNVDKLVKASRDANLRSIINECSLINADGMPVVWTSRLLGRPLKERVTGVDLFDELMRESALRGWRVFLLGAEESVVTAVRRLYESQYPNLKIVGHRNGFWSGEQEAEVVEQIRICSPDLLFVAMGSPHKERFLKRCKDELRVPFSMGVGGTFDVVVGKVKRAPLWMQKVGLEWFYRFLQEPRRMFRRYFIDDPFFLVLLAKELAASRRRDVRTGAVEAPENQ